VADDPADLLRDPVQDLLFNQKGRTAVVVLACRDIIPADRFSGKPDRNDRIDAGVSGLDRNGTDERL
jgi:hypothetical protein